MRQKNDSLLPYFIILLVGNTLLTAQINSPLTSYQFWLTAGAGPFNNVLDNATRSNHSGGNADLSFSYAKEYHLFSAHMSFATELGLLGLHPTLDTFIREEIRFRSIALLYGRMQKHRFAYWAFSAGPSYSRFQQAVHFDTQSQRMIGLSFFAQAFATLPAIGLGVYLTGNMNREFPFVAVGVAAQAGKLR